METECFAKGTFKNTAGRLTNQNNTNLKYMFKQSCHVFKIVWLFFSHNVMFLLLKLLIHLVIVAPIPVRLAAKDYLVRNVNPTLLKGLTELCKQKPKDPVVS